MNGTVLYQPQKVRYYRKKAFLVQAIQFLKGNRHEVFDFITAHPAAAKDDAGNEVIYLMTPNGPAMARLGDWIVKMEEDGYFVVTTANFYANYDSV